MAEPAPSPRQGFAPPAVVCRRQLLLPIPAPAATRDRLAAYLALVDRPLMSLLARERLRPDGPGHLTYRSNPHRVLHWKVVPTLSLAARWGDERLRVNSTRCQLAGLGEWGGAVGFSLAATLEPRHAAIAGCAEVALQTRVVSVPGAHGLACFALEHVLDRIERRLGRGFQKDVLAWLGEAAGTGRIRG
jgi:hypothetical protein